MTGAMFFLILSSNQVARAQSAFFDFRFTPGQTLAPGDTLSTDLSTLTIAPGTGPQAVTFDIWLTIVGGTAANTGLDQAKFRGFSQAVTSGGAFSTGNTGGNSGTAAVGAASAVGISPLFSGHVTASGAPTPTFKDYGSSTATTTPDGIFDLGGSTSTADLGMTLGATSNAVFANNPGATPSGGSSANGGGWQFDVARVTFNIGTASATLGAKTTFVPLNPITSAAAAVSINGSTFVNLTSGSTYLPGTALTFLVASTPKGSASWNRNDNGSYTDVAPWDPNQIPDGATFTATFGNGTTTTVNVPNVNVTVDGAIQVGNLVFNNTNGTNYTLANDGVAGHTLTLNNNGSGAVVTSTTGNNWIFPSVVLADNVTFNVAAGSSVLMSLGNISETGGSRTLTKTGGGTLTLDSLNTYTGTTTVNAGTLVTSPTGSISNAPLVVNSSGGVNSLASLNNNQTITSLSGTISGGGSATVGVAASTTLTIAQSTNTTFTGNFALGGAGAILSKTSGGTLESDRAPNLSDGSAINVSGGTLRFNVPSGSASAIIGSGVTATVSSTAVLQLAGAVSALSSSAHRVDVMNNSTAAAGLLVTGTSQQVGGIDGNGKTSVATGGALTANHVIQAALNIGGTMATPATVTIAPSTASGISLASSADLLSAGDGDGTLGASSLLVGAGGAGAPDLGTLGGLGAGQSAAVPEPSTILLAGLAGLACLAGRRRQSSPKR